MKISTKNTVQAQTKRCQYKFEFEWKKIFAPK